MWTGSVSTDAIIGYAGPMTDEEWHRAMLKKLDEWLAMHKLNRPKLFEHMYMSPETFIQWRETGFVPKEPRLCWVIFDDEIYNRIWA